MFSGIILVLILFIQSIKNKEFKKYASLYVMMVIGMLIAAYPQYKINVNIHNEKSVAVITKSYGGGLFTAQLYWGFLYDKYETYVGEPKVYPEPGVRFLDRAGSQILSSEGITEFESIGAYVRTVLKISI